MLWIVCTLAGVIWFRFWCTTRQNPTSVPTPAPTPVSWIPCNLQLYILFFNYTQSPLRCLVLSTTCRLCKNMLPAVHVNGYMNRQSWFYYTSKRLRHQYMNIHCVGISAEMCLLQMQSPTTAPTPSPTNSPTAVSMWQVYTRIIGPCFPGANRPSAYIYNIHTCTSNLLYCNLPNNQQSCNFFPLFWYQPVSGKPLKPIAFNCLLLARHCTLIFIMIIVFPHSLL